MTTSDPAASRQPSARLSRFLREPLLHFLLIGIAIFAFYGQRPQTTATMARTIEITPAQIERIAGQFESVWRRPPDATELEGLVDGYVREEIYYREALALGLDRDDTVIRRRLHLKMEFISDAAAEAMTPDDTVLQEYLDARPDLFSTPERISFRQIFLGEEDPAETLALLAAGTDPAQLGRGGLLPEAMGSTVESAVDGTFGAGFFAALRELDPGGWRGPVNSAYGAHLIWLDDVTPSTIPALADIRGALEADWRQTESERLRESTYQTLRARYEIITPEIGAGQ